jgi:hypothetical protein
MIRFIPLFTPRGPQATTRIAFLFVVALLGIHVPRAANAAMNTDPFVYDPRFYTGNAIEDRFAGSASSSFTAAKLAKPGNGDVVVAGLVPPGFQPDQGNGYFNIGLVRYDYTGGRVPWPNITPAYDYWNGMYIAYPNDASARYTAVRDIKTADGFIYVLADYQYTATDADVNILVFAQDGHFVGSYAAFDTTLDEHGAGLATYWYWCGQSGLDVCSRVIAVATYDNGAGRTIITAKRFVAAADGPLAVDTVFGPFGNGANDYPAPNSACLTSSQCSAHASAVAISLMIGAPESPFLYVGGELIWTSQQSAAAVLAIDGRTGNALSGFGSASGYARYPFTNGKDRTTGIAATDADSSGAGRTIYLGAWMQTYCAPAIGVLKLDGNGNGVAGFGNTSVAGMAFIGGDNDPSHCSGTLYPRYTFPQGIALGSSGLAIAGFEMRHEAGSTFTDPLLVLISSSDGAILDSRAARPPHANGAYFTDGGIWNDVITYNDRFVTTGPLYDSLGNRPLFGTARFVSDRIFGNDFEG